MTTDVNCPPRELLEAIHTDPILTLHILRQINALEFGLAKPLSSPKQAAVVVGVNIVKNLALSALDQKPARNSLLPEEINRFHQLAYTTGALARMLAHKAKLPLIQLQGIQVAGLIFSFELLAMKRLGDDDAFSDFFSNWKKGSLKGTELTMSGSTFDHGTLGTAIAEAWRLPEPLHASLANQRPDTNDEESQLPSPYDCVLMASAIANQWLLKVKKHKLNLEEKFPESVYGPLFDPKGEAAHAIHHLWTEFASDPELS
ncbi:MAG: HDOD domain-containing protein [Magnetococcales bacterium]|nr:HDOD domain-containing protein [Magnetococcales bacterium]